MRWKSRDKLNTLYLHLQKNHEHQTNQSADSQWEAPILKAAWPFDHVTHVSLRDNFKHLYLLYHNSYGQYGQIFL